MSPVYISLPLCLAENFVCIFHFYFNSWEVLRSGNSWASGGHVSLHPMTACIIHGQRLRDKQRTIDKHGFGSDTKTWLTALLSVVVRVAVTIRHDIVKARAACPLGVWNEDEILNESNVVVVDARSGRIYARVPAVEVVAACVVLGVDAGALAAIAAVVI